MAPTSTLEDDWTNLWAVAQDLAAKPGLFAWAQQNSDIADHVGAIHQLYPWITPGVALTLGASRYSPTDPFVKQIADTMMSAGRKALSQPPTIGAQIQSSLDKQILQADLQMPQPHSSSILDPIAHAIHTAASDVVGTIPSSTRSAAKTASRWTFGTFQSGIEAGSAVFRKAAADQATGTRGILNPLGQQSPWAAGHISADPNAGVLDQLTIKQMIDGKNAGSGIFPQGDAQHAAVMAQNQAASIGGHALTIGRGIAGQILPINSEPYRLVSGLADAGVALYADPAQHALSAVGEARKAGALTTAFGHPAAPGTDWGIFDNLRQTIGIRTASEQLDSRAGQGIIHKIAGMDQQRDIHHLLGRKVNPDITAALADAHTPEAVRGVLDTYLGTGIKELSPFHPGMQAATAAASGALDRITSGHIGTAATDAFGNPSDRGFGSLSYMVDRIARQWRPAQLVPGRVLPIDLTKPSTLREFYINLEAHLVNARVEKSNIDYVMSKAAHAQTTSDLYDAAQLGMKMTRDSLTRDFNLPDDIARGLTRITGGPHDVNTQWFQADMLDKMVTPGVVVNGEAITFDGAHLPTEALANNLFLPDPREIRRSAGFVRKFLRATGGTFVINGIDHTTHVLDAAQSGWKAVNILRPALLARVLGDSQLAMAANGDVSLFRHPIDAISWAMGHKGDLNALGDEFAATDYSTVLKGMTGRNGFDEGRSFAAHATIFHPSDPGFEKAWAEEIRHMHIDNIARPVAKAINENDLNGIKQAFWDGPLRDIRLSLEQPDSPHLWRQLIGQNRMVSDGYIDSVVQRLRQLSQDDPEIMQAIESGKFRDEAIAHLKNGKQLIGRAAYDGVPRSLIDRAGELREGGSYPSWVKGFTRDPVLGAGAVLPNVKNRMVNQAFSWLVGTPLEKLAASPEYRQSYWKHMTDMLPYANPDDAATIVRNAEKAGIHGLDASKATGILDAKFLHQTASLASLDDMSSILHDLGHRSQFWDMFRFVAPFGDAWQKVMKRWVGLLARNPDNIRRMQQMVYGLEGSSFVHKDPQSGQQVLTIPFSQQIDQKIAGLPFPQSAPLNGLSIIGQGLPGVGPAVTVPLSMMAGHDARAQQILDHLTPTGVGPDVQHGLLEAFLPGWAQRFRTAGILPGFGPSPAQQSVFNHSVGEVLRYTISSGKFDVTKPGQLALAVADARHKATMLAFVRGSLQATFPSAPSVDYMVKDKNGKMLNAYVLSNTLQNLYDGHGPDGHGHNDPNQATQIFLKLFGDANYLMLQPFSTPKRYGLPFTQKGADWIRAHPEFAKEYPNIFGMLVPQPDANDPTKFDYSLYTSQIVSGDRKDWKTEDWLHLANARIASMIYDQQRNALPDTMSSTDSRNYLASIRSQLEKLYPGYQDQSLNVDKLQVPNAITELSDAIVNPLVSKSPAAQATRAYLGLRQQIIDFAAKNGATTHSNSLPTGVEYQPMIQQLVAYAQRLFAPGSPYGTFFPVWDYLLSHESAISKIEQQPSQLSGVPQS